MRSINKKEAEAVLSKIVGGREALKRLISHSTGYDKLTPEQKTLVHPLREIYREEHDYMDKAVSYALRNYELNYDYLIKNFKL